VTARRFLVALLTAAAALAPAIADVGVVAAAGSSDPTGAVQTFEIQSSDFSFEAPTSIPAGRTRVVLRNAAEAEPHQAALVRLKGGATTGDYLAALAQSFEAATEKGTFVGGPNSAAPGADSGVVVDLKEGQYAVLCLIPSPDGVVHVIKGMVRDLTVTAQTAKPVKTKKLPTLTLRDYNFKIPKQLGRGAIEIVNKGKEAHEAVIAQLAPGQTVADVVNWVTPIGVPAAGPQPYIDVGGTTPIDPGVRVRVDSRLPKGKYVLLCFIPDAEGTSHLKLGMVHPFTVS
jgi:hypothetical protein